MWVVIDKHLNRFIFRNRNLYNNRDIINKFWVKLHLYYFVYHNGEYLEPKKRTKTIFYKLLNESITFQIGNELIINITQLDKIFDTELHDVINEIRVFTEM